MQQYPHWLGSPGSQQVKPAALLPTVQCMCNIFTLSLGEKPLRTWTQTSALKGNAADHHKSYTCTLSYLNVYCTVFQSNIFFSIIENKFP